MSAVHDAELSKAGKRSALVSVAESRGLAVVHEADPPTAPAQAHTAAATAVSALDAARTFPAHVQKVAGFDGWYRRVRVSSVLEEATALQVFGGLQPCTYV